MSIVHILLHTYLILSTYHKNIIIYNVNTLEELMMYLSNTILDNNALLRCR